jgi:hypothetical protein
MRAKLMAVASLFSFARFCYAQDSCTIHEQRRIWSLSARFTTGMIDATITLPPLIYRPDFLRVFLSVSGHDSTGLYMESGGERTPVINGATLHLTPKEGERIAFSLTRGNERLCTWEPAIRVTHGRPAVRYQTLKPFETDNFRNVGDPVMLRVGYAPDQPPESRIDGKMMAVLAQTPWAIWLQDPQPALGARRVQLDGDQVILHFIDVHLQLPAVSSSGIGRIGINVEGLSNLAAGGREGWRKGHLELLLRNFNPDSARLLCGDPIHDPLGLGADLDELRSIRLPSTVPKGVFTKTCRVKFLRGVPLEIDADIFQIRLPPRRRLTRF